MLSPKRVKKGPGLSPGTMKIKERHPPLLFFLLCFLFALEVFFLPSAFAKKSSTRNQTFEPELKNIKIGGKVLEDFERTEEVFHPADLPEGEMRISGEIKSKIPVEKIEISTDGGGTWNAIENKPKWSYAFKPREGEIYQPVFRLTSSAGRQEEFRTGVRFRLMNPEEVQQGEDPWQVLQDMARAYESKDFSAFMGRVTEDFPNRGELEEFVRRDFRDYNSIKVNLFQKQTVDVSNGKSVQADWEIQFTPTAVSRQIVVQGSGLDFVFVNEGGRLKLQRMRGENPLFGARSPDVAVSSGAPALVGEVLQKIEDQGTAAARASALAVVGLETDTAAANIPVTFELVDAFAHYTDGALEEVDFDAIASGRPIVGEARIRIIDNPLKLNFSGLVLQVTDSSSGESLTFTGNVEADQTVVFRTNGTDTFAPGESGTLTFVLDPDDKFIAIDREAKTERVSYRAV